MPSLTGPNAAELYLIDHIQSFMYLGAELAYCKTKGIKLDQVQFGNPANLPQDIKLYIAQTLDQHFIEHCYGLYVQILRHFIASRDGELTDEDKQYKDFKLMPEEQFAEMLQRFARRQAAAGKSPFPGFD